MSKTWQTIPALSGAYIAHGVPTQAKETAASLQKSALSNRDRSWKARKPASSPLPAW